MKANLTVEFVELCEEKGIEATAMHIVDQLLMRVRFPNGHVRYVHHSMISESKASMLAVHGEMIKTLVGFDHVSPAKPKELAKRIFSGEFKLPENGDYL